MNPIYILDRLVESDINNTPPVAADSLAVLVQWLGANWGWLPPADRVVLMDVGRTLVNVIRLREDEPIPGATDSEN